MQKYFLQKLVSCLFILFTITGCSKSNSVSAVTTPTPVPIPTPTPSSFAKGADISWLTEMETSGKKFYNSTGTETECMQLLKSISIYNYK